jgi:tRNA pseudouridine13 synthase
VPNYFGPQRFGRAGGNLEPLVSGSLPRRRDQGFAFVLSAARSLVFNAVLARRVLDHSWNRLRAGDLANLDGRGSVFAVDALTAELERRLADFDIHPTGPMWGAGDPGSLGEVQQLERAVADEFPAACALAVDSGLRQERRSLRLAVRELAHQFEGDALTVSFRLGKGSFATAVLRELFDAQPGAQDAGE